MRFDDVKTATLNLRVSPSFKLTLRAAAAIESRSMVNMLEVILIDYCDRNGWPEIQKPKVLLESTKQNKKVTRKGD